MSRNLNSGEEERSGEGGRLGGRGGWNRSRDLQNADVALFVFTMALEF